MSRSLLRAPFPVVALCLFGLVACRDDRGASSEATEPGSRALLIARADSFELDTPYEPPPGEAIDHHTSGFAKTLCSNVFISGFDVADAAENTGGFIAPFDERHHVVDTVVDFANERVSLTLPSGVIRTAKRYRSQGCISHPVGEDSVYFVPSWVEPTLSAAEMTMWPMGDVLPDEPWPPEVDMDLVNQALDEGFGPPETMTNALVVTYKGRILGERYGPGVDIHTPLESWSMGKSLSGTLIGVLIQQGEYELWQSAPVPEWQSPGDQRQEIRIGDIMRMSSGIRIRAPQDPEYDPALGYPDHLYLYTGTVNSFQWAVTRPQQRPPNTVGRCWNSDPVLTNYLSRLAVERCGEDYHAFPRRNLFDKLGMRDVVMETDPYGNFLTQGYEFLSARDWARLGNLYLQDGVWNGERILPEGWVEYASMLAPAWVADGRLTYGGSFFWVNGNGSWPVPESAFRMSGAGGQSAMIIPTHQLVVVRLKKYRGTGGGEALDRALELLMQAVPPVD